MQLPYRPRVPEPAQDRFWHYALAVPCAGSSRRGGPHRGRLSRTVLALVGLASGAGFATSGCNRETTAAAEPAQVQQHQDQAATVEARDEGPANAPDGAGNQAKAAPQASAGKAGDDLFDARELTDSVREASFALSIKPAGAYMAGQKGEAMIELLSLGAYKVNDKYPYKFKIKQADGLKLDSNVIEKDNVKLEKKRAVMSVPFTPESAGKKTLAGQFAFSVCTDDRCLIEKRDLKLAFDVAAP